MPDAALDPTTLAVLSGDPDALQTMRKYALAQQLQQMSLGGAQQPQQLGLEGRYPHAARVGPLSAAAPLVEALMARQGFKTAGPAMTQLLSGAYGLGTSGGPAPTSPSGPPMLTAQPPVGGLPPQGGPQPQPQGQPQGQAWYSVPGLPDNAARLMAITNRSEWAKLKLGPESWQQLVRGFNGDEQAAAQAVQAKATKEGAIGVRQGESMYIPGAGMIRNPQLPMGSVPDYGGPTGLDVVGSHQVPGVTEAVQSTEAAKVAATPHWEEDPMHPGYGHWVGGYQPKGPPQAPSGQTTPANTQAPTGQDFFNKGRLPTAADLEQQKKGAESGQAYSDKLNTVAESATEVRRSLAELKSLANTGGVSVSNPAKQELGSYLIAAGMDPQTVGNMLHTDVGALVAASKQTGSLAVDSIHQMTSRGSNFDLATFMRYNPNLDMGSPQGFQRVVDFMDKRMQQEVAKQADFNQWSRSVPPNQWASGHTTHWLSLQNKLINAGATNSNSPDVAAAMAAEKQRRSGLIQRPGVPQ